MITNTGHRRLVDQDNTVVLVYREHARHNQGATRAILDAASQYHIPLAGIYNAQALHHNDATGKYTWRTITALTITHEPANREPWEDFEPDSRD